VLSVLVGGWTSLPRLFRDETYVVFLYILFDLGFQLGSCDDRKIGFSWFSAWRKGVNMSMPVMADSGNLACCRNVRSPLMGVARRNNSNNIGTFLFFSSIPWLCLLALSLVPRPGRTSN
jgi:hypothetical protein